MGLGIGRIRLKEWVWVFGRVEWELLSLSDLDLLGGDFYMG